MIHSIPAALQSGATSIPTDASSRNDKRKSKFIEQLIAKRQISDRQSYLYGFVARSRPSLWAYLVIGPLGAAFFKNYQVLIDQESLMLAKVNILGKVETLDRIPFRDIKSFNWKRKALIHRIQLVLKNGRKLTLESNHRALVAMEAAFSTDEALTFVQNRIS